MAVQARNEIRSELRAPRDKNNRLLTGTTPTSDYATPLTFVPCNNSRVPSNQDEGADCYLEGSESVGEDGGCCMSGSGMHWRPTFGTKPSVPSEGEGEEEVGGASTKEGSNLEEDDEDLAGDGQLSLERCVCVCVCVCGRHFIMKFSWWCHYETSSVCIQINESRRSDL